MKIYTGMTSGKKLEKVKRFNLGFMISSTPDRLPGKECLDTYCALDNGAFISHKRGYPFMESFFLRTMDKCYSLGVELDFIVIPDLVGGGERSLDFSLSWIDRLAGARLALAVQDGMTPEMIPLKIPDVTTIFLGGSLEWKWGNIDVWKAFSDRRGLDFHVGRCGNLDGLVKADAINASSVDSTSFVRNDNWHVLETFEKIPSSCPSCGETPEIDVRGMISHYFVKGCMMQGSFTPKVWEHHAKSGRML